VVVTASKKRPERAALPRPGRRRGKRPPLRPPAFPTHAKLEELYEPLMQLPNMAGWYVGRKRKDGRLTKQLAIVCCVQAKVSTRELTAKERIPKTIAWYRTRRERVRLQTDVQEVGDSGFQVLPPTVGPGDVMGDVTGSSATARATIGIALRHPVHGDVVTTAGHAFFKDAFGSQGPSAAGSPIRIFNIGSGPEQAFEGSLVKAVVQAEADYALLKPATGPRNLFQDAFNLAGLFFPLPADIGTPLLVLTRRGLISTVLRGVFGSVPIGQLQMRGMILTDLVTQGGDSGCVLVDNSFRVWGLLAGFTTLNGAQHSVFSPVHSVIGAENAELI
jgi:hypothetical protein